MQRILITMTLLFALSSVANAQPVANDDRILRIETEEPGGPNLRAVYRATLAIPIEEADLNLISDQLIEQVSHTDAVGIRFVFGDSKPSERDPEAGAPFYAWRLKMKDGTDIFNLAGVTPSQATAQIKNFRIPSGEVLRGIWIDYTSMFGVLAITENGEKTYFYQLAIPTQKYLMKVKPSGHRGIWMEAIYQESDGKRYAADGSGTDSVGLHLPLDGSLRVHGGRYKIVDKPWLIAYPRD